MMKRIALLGCGLCVAWACHAADIAAYTEDLPPLNYAAGNEVKGFSSELLTLMAKEAGLDVSKEVMPWARAYRTVLDTPNTLLYTTVRNAEREPLFVWVGPVSPRQIYLYRLSSRKDISVNQDSDLVRYRNGAMFESAAARKLAGLGLVPDKSLDVGRNDEVNLKKLVLGRIDLVAMLDWGMAWQLRQQGLSQKLVQPAWLLDGDSQYWFALNRHTSPDKVRKLQAALDKLVANGTVKRLRSQYLED